MKNKNLSGGLFAAKPTPLALKETSLSNQIMVWLYSRGIYNDRLNAGKVETKRGNWITLCKPGTPDRFAIIRGQIVFIEVKKRGKTATAEQRIKHDELREHGAIVLVVDSLDDFIPKMKEIRATIEQTARVPQLYD
ncbi:MAG: VRR-NUC domain-containing protein [Acidobacteriota bacterium]|nr:VRR-NUC domain-containing protein [Acidobacteriota bacterium]